MTESFKERALLYWILILGLALRLYAAISHLDISHPDEHFQTLEPASHVVFGFGWLSWEWISGTRSWFVPGLYMPILWLAKLVGARGGAGPIVACRVLMAALSSVVLVRFWKLLEESGFKRGASYVSLAVFALSPACVAWGAMTLSDSWAVIFLWCSMPFILRALERNERVERAGLLLGLSFLARIQMALWLVGIGGVLLARGSSGFKTFLRFSLGYAVAIVFQAVLDWITWGAPLHSVVANIQKNLFENAASFYGTAPWYQYLIQIPEQLGAVVVTAVAFAVAIAVIRGARFREREWLIAVPAILYLGVHSLIAHKELRFIFPVIPAFFYFLAWSLSFINVRWRIQSRLAAGALGLIALACSGSVYSNDHTYPFDLSEITQKIREDGALQRGGCVLLVDHYWIWTRGELMIGAPIQFEEITSSQLPSAHPNCAYAITLPGHERWFFSSGRHDWKELYRDGHGQLLLKHVNS